MDAFVSRKRRRVEPAKVTHQEDAEESTDFKLAVLASLHPSIDESTILEALLASDGIVKQASDVLAPCTSQPSTPRKRPVGYQSSLSAFGVTPIRTALAKKPLVQKGKTLHLYCPEDVEKFTPCSLLLNFLPTDQADALLLELLGEAPSYSSLEFKLFDKVVKSPHSFGFYVNSLADVQRQKTEYIYDGRKVEDVRQSTPEMLKACPQVQEAVNGEIQRRIRDFNPGGKKLTYQCPGQWLANTAFVNCYDGPKEHVGYHSDQLNYIGPRAVIGSLSLGVAREFRVRKVLAEDDQYRKDDGSIADAQGQIAIHLPHNSLLIMHADMQEEWKHSIAPAQSIDPHPLAQNKRLNITYRYYKDNLHPKYTPRCHCRIPCVLRCVTKKKTRGRYMWTCHAHYVPGQDGCSFFRWADFDDDGEPPWAQGNMKEAKGPKKVVRSLLP
ncbi:hypothetical protein CC80DRAFT_530144 [Byssothecium circinans]|uniref:Uncharacterized protein n=1 Tax=Byssothecium circinans TaxID=147558 RepID=A0A6A5UEV7_9PLEO|nr:hypothetical protein CC80DRAFT_530144 [Byssothecium circinans]